MSAAPKVGYAEDEVCGRDGCTGHIKRRPVENCSCHLSAPCSACMEPLNYCSECDWEEVDEPKPEVAASTGQSPAPVASVGQESHQAAPTSGGDAAGAVDGNEGLRKLLDMLDTVSEALHYPACWDTAAYPSLADALSAVYHDFKCSQCAAAAPSEAAAQPQQVEGAAPTVPQSNLLVLPDDSPLDRHLRSLGLKPEADGKVPELAPEKAEQTPSATASGGCFPDKKCECWEPACVCEAQASAPAGDEP